jgi:glycosyltransferase involved in cell wall biosynthesis
VLVAHVVPGYLPARGGIENLLDGVAPVLRDDHGIQSVVIAPRFLRERPKTFFNDGLEVVSIDMPHRYSPESVTARGARLFSECRNVLSQMKPDILHIHGIWHLFSPMSIVGKSLRLPTVHHVHGEIQPTIRTSHKEILRDGRWLMAVSNPVARSIRSVTSRESPIAVLPNGIPDVLARESEDFSPHVALFGRLEGPKGFHQGLMALSLLVKEFPDIQISVVGVGEDLIALQRMAAKLGIAQHVRFLGRLTHQETVAVMGRCLVVLIPSLLMEGFSIVAAEAALLRKPVVSYRVGGLAETVVDGVTGTVVSVNDVTGLSLGVLRYLRNPDLRRRHGETARSRALADFGVFRFAAGLANQYQLMIHESKG